MLQSCAAAGPGRSGRSSRAPSSATSPYRARRPIPPATGRRPLRRGRRTPRPLSGASAMLGWMTPSAAPRAALGTVPTCAAPGSEDRCPATRGCRSVAGKAEQGRPLLNTPWRAMPRWIAATRHRRRRLAAAAMPARRKIKSDIDMAHYASRRVTRGAAMHECIDARERLDERFQPSEPTAAALVPAPVRAQPVDTPRGGARCPGFHHVQVTARPRRSHPTAPTMAGASAGDGADQHARWLQMA